MGLLRFDPGGELHLVALVVIVARHAGQLFVVPFEDAAFALVLVRHAVDDDGAGLRLDRGLDRLLIAHRREGRIKPIILEPESELARCLALGRGIVQHPAVLGVDAEDLFVDAHHQAACEQQGRQRLAATGRPADPDHGVRLRAHGGAVLNRGHRLRSE